MKPILVYIDSDFTALGHGATKSDLDTYATNLSLHLEKKFPGFTIEVKKTLGGGRTPCPDHEMIDLYVRNLQNGAYQVEL